MRDDRRPPPQRSLPVLWKGAEGATIHDRALVIADGEQTAVFGDPTTKTCGSCRHFRGVEKDRPAIGKFLELALLEAKWKLGFLTHAPEDLSRCRMNEELAVGVNSKSCEQYAPGNGRSR